MAKSFRQYRQYQVRALAGQTVLMQKIWARKKEDVVARVLPWLREGVGLDSPRVFVALFQYRYASWELRGRVPVLFDEDAE